MNRFKRGWKHTPRGIRIPVVFLIGWLVVLAGLIMLVTPGPGWAAIFLGFAILATEFASAGRVRNHMVRVLKAIISRLKKLWLRLIGRRKNRS
jgi:uncharacterized protein (TIGR02611 family)